jgi:ribosome biogenesis ATPase
MQGNAAAGPSLNQSITAAWGTPPSASAPKKRIKRTLPGLNNPTPEITPPEPQSQPETRPPTPVKRRRRGIDPNQLASKYAPPDLKLGMLGGLKDQITQLMEIVVLPLLHPEIYQFTGVVRPRGVLLHGVPGGGKTQLVKCLAGVSGRMTGLTSRNWDCLLSMSRHRVSFLGCLGSRRRH